MPLCFRGLALLDWFQEASWQTELQHFHEINFFGSSSQPFALGDVVVLVEATGYQLTSTVEYRQDQPDDEPEIRELDLC